MRAVPARVREQAIDFVLSIVVMVAKRSYVGKIVTGVAQHGEERFRIGYAAEGG